MSNVSTRSTFNDYFQQVLVPRESRSEAMQEFLKLYLEIMKSSQESATTLGATHFNQQMKRLQVMADEIRSEGKNLRTAGMVQGGMAIGSALAQMGFGGVAAKCHFKASTGCAIAAAQFNLRAATYTAAAQGFSGVFNATGQFTSADMTMSAKHDESDRVEAQTDATIYEQGNAQSKEMYERNQKNAESIVEAYKAAQQAEAEQMNLAARA